MIGHWLLTLSPAQEEALLTRAVEPVWQHTRAHLGLPAATWDCQCVVGTTYRVAARVTARGLVLNGAAGVNYAEVSRAVRRDGTYYAPGYLYESLCERFGLARVNGAIRARILANQIRRVLPPGFYAKPKPGALQPA